MDRAWKGLPRDGRLLFLTRFLRLFGYGLISIVLVLYLDELGISQARIGALLTLTLAGDAAISLWLSATADRFGRKRTLIAGAMLVVAAGVVFAATRAYWLLVAAATIGVISPSGNEVGPFLSIEQASLSHVVSAERRTSVFAWYHLTGAVATALGTLSGGFAVDLLHRAGWSMVGSFRGVVVAYAGAGAVMAGLFCALGRAIEPSREASAAGRARLFGMHRSSRVILKLSSLFALDAFAGGFVVQSIAVYWFHLRFGAPPSALGAIFFGANLVAGASALAAVPIARRIGLVETMVVTHIPSNLLLMLVPLMPTLQAAAAVLLVRFSISQMDVPTRQAYVMSVVEEDERSAAAGVTGVARTAGAAISPAIAVSLVAVSALSSLPFFLAGGLKIVYDLLVWRGFRGIRSGESRGRVEESGADVEESKGRVEESGTHAEESRGRHWTRR